MTILPVIIFLCFKCLVQRQTFSKRWGFPVLYSDELPREAEGKHGAIDEKGFVREGASILGTMSYYPPVMGQMLAGYVLCKLAGLEWF